MSQNQCPHCAMSVSANEEFCSFCGARLEPQHRRWTFGDSARWFGALCLSLAALGFGGVGSCLLVTSQWGSKPASGILIGFNFLIVAAAFLSCAIILVRWKKL